MQKGIVFIAPLGTRNKKANIFKEIVSSCPEGNYSSVLYVTPTAFGEEEARREFNSYLKANHKKTAYIPFDAIPLKQVCTNLYETSPSQCHLPDTSGEEVRGKEILSANIRPLILCEVLREKRHGDAASQRDEVPLGYAVLLSELLYKLGHYVLNKDISQIKEEVRQLIFEEKTMQRAVDALEMLETYERRLEEKRRIDYESALKESIPLIYEYANPALLVLDGFFDPTPLELEIIKALIKKADKACVLVEEEAEFLKFFESSEESKKWEEKTEKLKKTTAPRENTGYYVYPSMEDEVEGIARAVKGLILEGTRPSEIIVSFPSLAKYIPMLKRVFKKHGIAPDIAECGLSNAKPVVALEDMISSMQEDYPRNEFLSFLASAYFPDIPGVVKEWAAVYANRAGVIKGRQAWLSIKNSVLASSEGEISGHEKSRINEFQKGISSVINILEGIRQAGDPSSFTGRLEAALEKFGFSGVVEKPLLGSISNLLADLSQFSEMSGSNTGSMEMSLYLRLLLKGIKDRSERLVTEDEQQGGVRVLPYEFASGLESKAMFLGGMVEGEFPSKPEIDPVLPEKVKKAMGMPFLEYYLDRQRRYFKRLLNVSADEPYFSYPSGDADKVFLPSPFLAWGQQLAPPALNISTEEEMQMAEGFSGQKDFTKVLWDGILPKGKGVKGVLQRNFRQEVFIRVTDIDAYRKCPLRFYIEKVLKLEIEKPPRFEVEAKLWGSLAHKVMEYLYSEGAAEDISRRIMQGLELALQSRDFGILGEFWSNVAREIFQRLIPEIEAQEAQIRMQGFSPYLVEKNLKAEINGIKLKGKIDRIDKKGQRAKGSRGQTLESSNPRTLEPFSVVLLDYKTGSIDKDSLQLPLYAALWQKESGGTVEKVGFYSLKDGSIEWFPKKGISMEEFIQNALQTAQGLIQQMREGIFEPAPYKENECWYCNHSPLCKGGK